MYADEYGPLRVGEVETKEVEVGPNPGASTCFCKTPWSDLSLGNKTFLIILFGLLVFGFVAVILSVLAFLGLAVWGSCDFSVYLGEG